MKDNYKPSPESYLTNCTDQELFEIVNGIEKEITKRLINLFYAHKCTVVYTSAKDDVSAKVNDVYDTHNWNKTKDVLDKWVDVAEVGYATILDEEDKPLDYLYIVTNTCEQYSNDEICGECLWDVYKSVKDIFEKAK